MIFKTFDGKTLMALHQQNLNIEVLGPRKPILLEIDLSGNELNILERYSPKQGDKKVSN